VLAYLCALMNRILLLVMLSLLSATTLRAQGVRYLNLGSSGNIPAWYSGDLTLLHESDLESDAASNWQIMLDSTSTNGLSPSLAIGFPVQIGSSVYTHLRASGKGYITFDTAAPVFAGDLKQNVPIAGFPFPRLDLQWYHPCRQQ
jgi:hypothetical protein